jgi:hypothetical protein
VAAVAAAVFVWAVSILWFGYPSLSPAALSINAMVLIFLWAIGPAVWFAVEARIWKSEPSLATEQQYARDFWIGTGVIVLLLAANQLGGPQKTSQVQYTVSWSLVVEVIRILAWPLLAAVGFLLFREPLASFFIALGSRTSKIGAFSVSIELSALPEARVWSGPALDDLRAEHPAAAGDSSVRLFRAIADATYADYITVDLENGEAWLTSRLFILAALIPRVRHIKRIVFLGSVAGEFIGETAPNAVAETLAQRFPWLEEAYIKAHVSIDDNQIKLWRDASLLGPVDPMNAGVLLDQFLDAVKGNGSGDQWVDLGSYKEHAEWVTPQALQSLLGRRLEINVVKRDPSIDSVLLAKTLLRHESTYVAVVDPVGRFTHLIDRYRAVDQVVRQELG